MCNYIVNDNCISQAVAGDCINLVQKISLTFEVLLAYEEQRERYPSSMQKKLKRTGRKVTKLKLDLIYFETCLELRLCPQFLKFKMPKLSIYKKL